jgi:CxxC-x17-CxxC domain-containing protein
MSLQEKIIETKICTSCHQVFNIYEEEIKMLEKFSPIFGGKKYLFPMPKECPTCRSQKRYIWRNTNKLFRRKCDFSGEEILAFYDEKVTHPVYEVEIWRSDKWNALDYGRDFDFSRPFFEQLSELNDAVPHYSRSIINLENSKFSNNATALKNCYLCFNWNKGEDCYYGINFYEVKDCVDCYAVRGCENCYECTDCNNCHTVFFSQDSDDCHKSFFLKNCIACENCFWCKNLSNKKYHIFNQAYNQEEYEKKIKKLLEEKNVSELKEMAKEIFKNLPEKFMHEKNIENVSWDYINNGKNIIESFNIMDGENIFYGTNLKGNVKNLLDVDLFWYNLFDCYNSAIVWNNSSRIFFSADCFENVNDLFYCICCIEWTKNCFGCVWLKQKEYCIFNKQYTKAEYEKLVPKIIEHMMTPPQSPSIEGEARNEQGEQEWWEFFPPVLSSFAYNDSEAQYIFPLNPKADARGLKWKINYIDREGNIYKSLAEAWKKTVFKWSTAEAPFPKVEKIISADKLPKNITEIPDDILNWAIECEITKKPFRIIKQELDFYRRNNLPIPKIHPDQRHIERLKLRNPRKLFARKCDKCGKDIQTTYAPERKEIVYCKECYSKEII